MQITSDHASTTADWADAVFVSVLQRSDQPDAAQVREAAAAAVRAFGYPGCAGRVAQEFGEHPETAATRMRWACDEARAVFADPAPQRAPGAEARPWPAARPRVPAQQPSGSWRCRAA